MGLDYIILMTLMSVPGMLILFMLVAKIHFKYHNKLLHIILGTSFSILNFLLNAWTVSILGLELPHWHKKEFPTTKRMQRWKKGEGKGPKWLINWRLQIANKICKFLNRYDPGHC